MIPNRVRMTGDSKITLRKTVITDLEVLFKFQLDEEANHLAAFTSKDPSDKAAYLAKYTRLLHDPTINNRTILLNNAIVGSIAKFIMHGDAEITYWIDKSFWGRGRSEENTSELQSP